MKKTFEYPEVETIEMTNDVISTSETYSNDVNCPAENEISFGS